MNLIKSLSENNVLVSIGTGGVGKTTMSCAMAISIAHAKSAKVLVITIDPAKRLGSILSVDSIGHKPVKIDHKKFFENDQTVNGEVHAITIDMSQGWDELVNRYSKSEKDAEKIFDNIMYQNLTTRFTHSHDFIAMDQLYEYYYKGEYDYIVLDTPPMSQAYGFFDAPKIVSEFFGGKILNLIISPYKLTKSSKTSKIFDLASQPFLLLANKVLGKSFLNDIGEFFYLFKKMYDPILERSNEINMFLKSESLDCVLISNPIQYIENTFIEAKKELQDREMTLNDLIVNMTPYSESDYLEVSKYLESEANANLEQSFIEFLRSDINMYEELDVKFKQNNNNTKSSSFKDREQLKVYPIPKSFETDLTKRLTNLVKLVLESNSTK